jgi:hypothetical protein
MIFYIRLIKNDVSIINFIRNYKFVHNIMLMLRFLLKFYFRTTLMLVIIHISLPLFDNQFIITGMTFFLSLLQNLTS